MRHLIYIVFLFHICLGKIYKKCELATDLKYKYNLTAEEVKNWVCIAEYESTFNSEAINEFNWDGSRDFGLFQINNRYWCGSDHGSNVCNIQCEALLDDDLTDDLACANRVKKDTESWMKTDDGLVAWVAYTRYCKNKNLDDYIAECLVELSSPPSTEPSTVDTTERPAQEMVEVSTSPPRASGLEPPTVVAEEESSSDSESIPIRVSGSGISQGDSDVEGSDIGNEMTTDLPTSTSSVLPETSSTQKVSTVKSPPRASGLGIVIRPSDDKNKGAENVEKNKNVISLENIPLRISVQEEIVKVNEAPPLIEESDSDRDVNIPLTITTQEENVKVNEAPSLMEESDSSKVVNIPLTIATQEENVKVNEAPTLIEESDSVKDVNIPLRISEQEESVKTNEATPLIDASDSVEDENIPLTISGQEENVSVNEAPSLKDVPDLESDEKDDSSDLESDSLKQILEDIEKGLIVDPFYDNLEEPQFYDNEAFSDELYSQQFQERDPHFETINRYSFDSPSYQDFPLMQLLQGNNQAQMYESRLPDSNIFQFNPNRQESIRPETLNTYQPFKENSEVQNLFSLRYPESSDIYLREFDPKTAFGYVFPISNAHVSNIFKPFSFFNLHKTENNHGTTNVHNSESKFNFVKPILVPELDFQPIDINIKKLIKPVKIPIPYPNINIVKETADSVNIKDFIKPQFHKPQFNVHPVQVGFKRIVKPVIVPTIDKKLVEVPKLGLKKIGIPFYKPSFGKTEPAERTFTQPEDPYVSFQHDFIPSDRTLMDFPYNF